MQPRYLSAPGYAITSLLVLIPLFDSAVSSYPPRVGDGAWRFGTAGLFSRALMTPLLGLLLAFGLALLLGHRRVQRAISVLSGLAALAVVAVMVLFSLDAVQLRAQVVPQARTAFDMAAVIGLGKYGIGLPAFAALAVAGWRSSRGAGRREGRAGRREGLIVGGARAGAP